MNEAQRIQAAAEFLRAHAVAPRALIVLGTGLGGMGERLEERRAFDYGDIPHFPQSTAPGHAGQLVYGTYEGVPALIMEGRFHYYEGYTLAEVVRPIRVARLLGAQTLLITSAVGGMNAQYRLGEIVAIEDHINGMGDSPLRGPNLDDLGPRFPDMSAPYSARLIDRVEELAHANGDRLLRAVLVAVAGPQLETRAEYRALRQLGADIVGMSTVPENIAAVHAGMEVCALSVVTDLCFPDALEPAHVESIIKVANEAAPQLENLVLGLLAHA